MSWFDGFNVCVHTCLLNNIHIFELRHILRMEHKEVEVDLLK